MSDDYSHQQWLARQRHMLIAEEAAAAAEKKRRAARKAKRDLSFLVDDDVLHPIDPRDVRY